MMSVELLLGDSFEVLKNYGDNTFDSIVTDPPYGLGFMGRDWDKALPNPNIWKQCLRVLKPGGHLVAFGGTRTHHRLWCQVEDVGFEVRDTLCWLFGSGFPKSLDISKSLDKGHERPVIGTRKLTGTSRIKGSAGRNTEAAAGEYQTGEIRDSIEITGPATGLAKQYDGWFTGLKPGFEPILLARKPVEGSVVDNVRKWGTGGLNIGACRLESSASPHIFGAGPASGVSLGWSKSPRSARVYDGSDGRFPPNVVLDEGVSRMLGGASRFFYSPKAGRKERELGLDRLTKRNFASLESSEREGAMDDVSTRFRISNVANVHPTVKPVELMCWLCRLVTPPGGIVLDPFLGSGTTGVAAVKTQMSFVGIEINEAYYVIAKERVNTTERPVF